MIRDSYAYSPTRLQFHSICSFFAVRCFPDVYTFILTLLSMHYHFAILLLFRPFIKLDIMCSSVAPRDVCGQASDAVSALVKSYTQLYSLRCTPSFVLYFLLASSIVHLVTLGNSRPGPEKLRQGLADLKEIRKCHAFAVRAINILRSLNQHWEVKALIPEEGEEPEDMKNMCRPRSNSLNQFCPNVKSPDQPVSLTDSPGRVACSCV
jgi:hypothetical protein